MKKKSMKILSVVMCICFMFAMTTSMVPTYAAETPEQSALTSASSSSTIADFGGNVYNYLLSVVCRIVDKAATMLISGIAGILPQNGETHYLEDYQTENFYSGHDEFVDTASKDAAWNLGYAQRILTPADLTENTYYMGGFAVANKIVDKFDDIKVRAFCIDDGTGRGKVMFAVIDAIGICNQDIRNIRALLADYAKANNIVSINISTTHTHSGIDTQGIWAIFGTWKSNPISLLKTLLPIGCNSNITGVNQGFMNSVYTKTADALKEACDSMTQGKLYYAEKNIGEYLRYRNDEVNFLENMSRIRFVPDNGSTPTLIANFGCHPETVGLQTGDNPGNIMSADFIPYMEEVVNNGGYNFVFIQGAIGEMITASQSLSDDGVRMVRYDGAVRFGQEMGYIALGMTMTEDECIANVVDHEREKEDLEKLGEENASKYTPWYENWAPVEEETVAPILNIAISEVIVKCDNPVVKVLAKLAVTDNLLMTAKNEKNSVYTVTEVGYLEIGEHIKVLMSPGESNPEFVVGGATMTACGSIQHKDFQYNPLKEYFDEEDKILVFDVMNDAAGYINPDNDYALAVFRFTNGEHNYNTNALLFSLTSNMGSTLIGNFLELVENHK